MPTLPTSRVGWPVAGPRRKTATLFAALSSEMRPASRSIPVTFDCSPIHSMILGEIPREGRRAASARSERVMLVGATVRRSHASAAATPVRLRKPRPSRSCTGIPPSIRAAWTGASKELTRVSTAISEGLAPSSRSCWTRSAVLVVGSSWFRVRRVAGADALFGPALIVFGTRTRLRDRRFVAAVTTGAGHL